MSDLSRSSSKLGLWLATIFLGLFILSGLALTFLPHAPGDSGESGVIVVIFAIPWIFFLDSMHLPTSLPAYEIINIIITLIVPVAINAAIIYLLGNFLGDAFRGVNSEEKSVAQIPTGKANELWKSFNIFFWIIFIIYFFPLLQMIFPISGYFLGIYSITSITSKLGGIIILSYFGYALSLKKGYLLLGLLALIPYLNIGLAAGYFVILQLKGNWARASGSKLSA